MIGPILTLNGIKYRYCNLCDSWCVYDDPKHTSAVWGDQIKLNKMLSEWLSSQPVND